MCILRLVEALAGYLLTSTVPFTARVSCRDLSWALHDK